MNTYVITDGKLNRLFSFEHEDLTNCSIMVHKIKERKTEQIGFNITKVNEDVIPADETVEYFYKGDFADGIEVNNNKGRFGITIRKERD